MSLQHDVLRELLQYYLLLLILNQLIPRLELLALNRFLYLLMPLQRNHQYLLLSSEILAMILSLLIHLVYEFIFPTFVLDYFQKQLISL
jgi:hypothetical protein